MENWLKELLDLGIGRIAIKHLALLEAKLPYKKWEECPRCHTPIKKWARTCPKCRTPLP